MEASRIIETLDGNVEVYFSTSRRIIIDRRISISDIPTSEKEKAQSRSLDIAYAMYEPVRSKSKINIIDFDEFQINEKLLKKEFDSKKARDRK